MWCILGGMRVCCMEGVCMVYIKQQRTRGVLYSGRQGLYGFDVDVIEEMMQKEGFGNHICICEGMDQIGIIAVIS